MVSSSVSSIALLITYFCGTPVSSYPSIRTHLMHQQNFVHTRLNCASKNLPDLETQEELRLNQTDSLNTNVAGIWFDPRPIFQAISIPNLLAGFIMGGIVAVGGVIGPYLIDIDYDDTFESSIAADTGSIQKPVTLFEDILVDLKQGYVDDINTNRLFESAVGAMLKTLDPYTEFENLGAAKSFQESVSGKYGGVGMIISGARKSPATEIGSMSFDKNSDGSADKNKLKEVNSKTQGGGVSVVDAFEG